MKKKFKIFRGLFYKVSLKRPPPINTLTFWAPYKGGLTNLNSLLFKFIKNNLFISLFHYFTTDNRLEYRICSFNFHSFDNIQGNRNYGAASEHDWIFR